MGFRPIELFGDFEINKKLSFRSFSALMDNDSFRIVEWHRIGKYKLLSLAQIDKLYLKNNEGKRLLEKEATNLEFENIGLFSEGPLGHPGDNERYRWPVTKYSIEINPNSDGLEFIVSAITSIGSDPFISEKVLDPLEIKCTYILPQNYIESFFR